MCQFSYSVYKWYPIIFFSLFTAVVQLVESCTAPSCPCKCHYFTLCHISFLELSESPAPQQSQLPVLFQSKDVLEASVFSPASIEPN